MAWQLAGMAAMMAVSTAMQLKAQGDAGAAAGEAGQQRMRAQLWDAFQAEQQAKDVGLQAAQEQNLRMLKLDSMLATNAAVQGSMGIEESAHGQAITDRLRYQIGQEMQNVAFIGTARQKALETQADRLRWGAGYAATAGGEAQRQASMQQLATLATTAASVYSMTRKGGA